MIYATLYRPDLITGEHTQATGRAVIGAGSSKADIHHLHALATMAAHRSGASAYRIYEGSDFINAKPISLLHIVKGL